MSLSGAPPLDLPRQARDREEAVRGLVDLIDGLDDARLVALHRAVTSIGAPA